MFAITATAATPDDPLAGLRLGEHPDPSPPPGWEVVRVRAASLNHHDVWTLRGVGIDPDRLPIVLGCDAAGVTEDGREVVVHAVVATSDGDETLASDFNILSERYDGTFADLVAVPSRNLIDKPAGLSFEEAACLPTAYLTAYRMLFTRGELRPGDRVLVQGAGGGVATAAILLGRAAGLHVSVTSRDQAKLAQALDLGAHVGVLSGERLPGRVDAVLETVGEATWKHSLRALEPGGVVVVSGATSGPNPPADLARVFYRQLRVVGSTMGTRAELQRLVRFLDATGVRPLIDDVLPMDEARAAFGRMVAGELFGKLVLTRSG
ncbi:zinc-binding dehydrogenase [Egicoccus sp. AB-alg6-2]|uniref:zinc-binding dehydrogenase n=1 Tax=Egicoccus sp. AB-alg6-2 TaxID=3242692 RepID=UPI00359EEF4A